MVDGISQLFSQNTGKGETQPRAAAPADAHGLAAALEEKQEAPGLGSIFSGQTKALRTREKENLETRLNRYKAQKQEAHRVTAQDDRQDRDQDHDPEEGYEGLAQEVAEQILTGVDLDGDRFCENEVIIRIKPDILEDAHVHLIMEEDCLRVRLVTSCHASLQTLIGAQHRLAALLETHYEGLIRLSVHHTGRKA